MKKTIILIFIFMTSVCIYAEEVDFKSNTSIIIIDTKINSVAVNTANDTKSYDKEKGHKDFYMAEECFRKGDYESANKYYEKYILKKLNKKILDYIK
ncbi:MAG: hypothetical protein N2Z20_02810 [Elusimicrobiales bacterium]|nr:hypothetical protein [Elusimicrobiales bacterium]